MDNFLTIVKTGSLEQLIDLLKKEKLNTHEFENESMNPFMLSAWKQNTEMLKVFLDYGMPIDIKNSYGETALMAAIEIASFSTVQFLISKGAKINLKNYENKSIFDYAIENYGEEGEKIIKILLSNHMKTSKKELEKSVHPTLKVSILEFYENLLLKETLDKTLKQNIKQTKIKL